MPTFSPTLPVSRGALVDKVTQLFGLKGDSELRAVALGFLDDAIKETNSYLFEFNKNRQDAIVLTENEENYTLDGSPYKEVQAFLVSVSNNNEEPPMHYLPYVQFKRLTNSRNSTGTIESGNPYIYTFRNIERDGVVTLFPAPAATTATDYTLTVEFYVRIPLLSELPDDDARLQVPQEVETALTFASQKRLAIHINGPAHPDVIALDALEQRALARLIAIDRHHPDSATRFRIAGHDRRANTVRGRGVMLIKI